jgi:hypothetical protein
VTLNNHDAALVVFDPNEGAWAGTFRLVIDRERNVAVFSMHGNAPLQEWNAASDLPRFENQADGLSIRIGFKRYVIEKSETADSIKKWRAIAEVTDIDMPIPDDANLVSSNFADDVIRYKNLLDSGSITRGEFDLLISSGAQSTSTGGTASNNPQQEMNAVQDQNLVEFQKRWQHAFGLSYGPIPTTLDERALFNALVRKKTEIEKYKPDFNGITRWCAVNKVGGITLFNAHKFRAEFERSAARGRPLPDFVQSIINREIEDQKNPAKSLIDFARMQGWGPMPSI